ncbi:MAG: hypothetical protein ACTSWX_07120 [Promethearchaeota archaeon]
MTNEDDENNIDFSTEEKFDEDELDEVFKDLKKEIIEKREFSKEKFKKTGYYCKLCGEFTSFKKEPISSWRTCSHCHIPINRKCRSCGLCLNCFINLNDEAQKTLKLMRFLIWFVPIFSGTFLFFQGFIRFLLSELFLIILFSSLYFYTLYYINNHSERYYNNRWESIIKENNYKVYLDPYKNKRYLDDHTIERENKKIEKRKEKLKRWIEPDLDYSKIPIPAHIKEYSDNMNPKIENKTINKENTQYTNRNVQFIENKSIYKLKKCPKCGKEIKFANFCPSCNRKFCPECGTENVAYNRLCLCGFVFPVLEEEFYKWAGTNEVKYIKKDKND